LPETRWTKLPAGRIGNRVTAQKKAAKKKPTRIKKAGSQR
jgi:hypothetical protein